MSDLRKYADVAVGDELPPLTVVVTRADLVRYAGAALDFNPIHWNEATATGVGLPNVIAHGMLTMAYAGRVVTDWAGDPGAVVRYGTKFTRPVVVPDDGVGGRGRSVSGSSQRTAAAANDKPKPKGVSPCVICSTKGEPEMKANSPA